MAARESLTFENYAARLLDSDEDIQALAKTVPELVFVVSAAYLSNAPELSICEHAVHLARSQAAAQVGTCPPRTRWR